MKQEFINHLSSYLSQEEIDSLIASFNQKSVNGLILNKDKMDEKTLLSLFPNIKKHPIVPYAYIFDKDEYQLGKTIYHELGCFYLQEPSAILVSYLLNPDEKDTLLDLCAAPGGKSIGASFLMNNKGLIISNDLAKDRCYILQENIQRMGRGNVIITNNDFSYIYQNYQNYFSKIILDAPCSGSGMFRKDEKMIEDWSLNKVFKFSLIQSELIDICYSMLAPGGYMVYSTCSYSYEEDELVIKHLLEHTDATIVPIEKRKEYYFSKDNLGIHLFPHLFNGEGHYICLIKKPGEIKYRKNNVRKPHKEYPHQIESFDIKNFNNVLFGLYTDFTYKKLNIIQYGLKIGEVFSKGINYDYHLSHYLDNYPNEIELDKQQIQKYLNGEEIVHQENLAKGNILLKYQGIPVDFSKNNGNIIKNHYPKKLRKKDMLL